MNAVASEYPTRAALRVEFFRNLTVTLRTGHPLSVVKRLSNRSVPEIAHSVGLPAKLAEQCLNLHALFVSSFGTKSLAVHEDESVIIDPLILNKFLSQPAAIRLVSDISTMSEVGIRSVINQT